MTSDNIRGLMKFLPEGFASASRETKAMQRTGKGIKDPSDLMWLMLTHLSQGQSLANMSALCTASGVGRLSNVSVMNRLAGCGGWFKWVLARLAPAGVADYLKPKGLSGYRILAVDASDVKSGMSKFSATWHLHYALDVFTLTSHEMKLTESAVGETLTHFTAAKGDLFLGDRIYGSKKGISHCLNNEADFILRLHHDAFAMRRETGERLDLLKPLAPLKPGETADIPVYADLSAYGLGTRKLRVCAVRKSDADIEKTMKRIDARDAKCERTASEDARRFNAYVAVITSLPPDVSADEVLGAYRYRWQVELFFKRLKSLLGAGEVPKKRTDSMKAWLNGKMILALLYEILLSKRDFSPLGRT